MRRVVLLLFLALFSLPLCAQQSVAELAAQAKAARALPANAPTRDQVLTLFELLQVRKNMVTMLDSMKKMVLDGAEQNFRQHIPDATPKQLELMGKMIDDVFSELHVDEFVDVTVSIYQNHLTKSDIDEIIRFYSSPVGQKLLREQPQMMQESMKAAGEIQQKKMESISQKIDQRMREFIDASQDKSPSPK